MNHTCPNCGAKLPASSKPGRPLKFCSEACRRAAEFEKRRVNDRLKVLEQRASEWRVQANSTGILKGIEMDDPLALEKEIELQRRRLLELCEEP
jgi:hypothetical protein